MLTEFLPMTPFGKKKEEDFIIFYCILRHRENESKMRVGCGTRDHVHMGGLFFLIILSWIIRWTHLQSVFMRCAVPNPIGNRPNLLQKLCSFQL